STSSFFAPGASAPVEILMNSGLKPVSVRISRGKKVRHFMGDFFRFNDLKVISGMPVETRNTSKNYPPMHFFPVANIPDAELSKTLPWRVYAKVVKDLVL